MNTLADRLKQEREARGLTQEALAKRVGKNKRQSLISNIEKGTYKSSPWLPEIAYALGIHAMWLKNGIGPKEIHGGHAVHEPAPTAYPANVTPLPTNNPLRTELAIIAERMTERGLQVLIYEAEKIDKLYPKAQPKPFQLILFPDLPGAARLPKRKEYGNMTTATIMPSDTPCR